MDGWRFYTKQLVQEIVHSAKEVKSRIVHWHLQQSRLRKRLSELAAVLGIVFLIFALFFYKRFIGSLVDLSDHWSQMKYGKLVLFLSMFFVGFPPLIGYTALSLLCGMSYGFPYGWPLIASASVMGSFASFLVFRYLLHQRAIQLMRSNEKVRAFSEILRDDSSLLLLILIRLCPLPYSLSNGALAGVPELPAQTFFLASLLTSPKLFIHIFIGSKIKELGDANKATSTKVIDLISITITTIALTLSTYLVYKRMKMKLETYHHNSETRGVDQDLVFGNFTDLEEGREVEMEGNDEAFVIDDEEGV